MRCSICHHENPDRAKFCLECGARLPRACPHCGTELPAGAKFCLECGRPLTAPTAPRAEAPVASESPEAAAAPGRIAAYTPRHLAEKILKSRSALEGERRQVTVLFADLAGFTTLAERLDPEEVHRIVDECFELITAEVHRFEGTINQYTGDGVMALFGAPVAHEDAPRRAVHAALGIQRSLRDFSRRLQGERGLSVQMRIGLNTGPVVVGRIGDDLRMDYTAVGDTTNLAARMQQSARPGSVLVTEATYRLVSGFFETLDLGEVAMKGHAPARAFEVLRPRLRRTRFEVVVERGLTPLVGRAPELGTLMDRFAEVKAGRGQVVFVAGEAGIGKSRLLLEFRRNLVSAGEEVTWLEGQCVSFGQSISFLPLVDQLRENFRIGEFDGEPEIIAKVEHGMRRMGQLEPHIPYVRYLLSVDPGDPAISVMDPLERRKRAFDAVRALTLRGASLRPLVLVFEDLHWVDSATEEYLAATMDSVTGVPLMLALTHRVGYTPPFGTRSFQTNIGLRALSGAEALAMAGRVLGTERFPEELRAALMEKAEGVPLFIEEVTKTLLDLGVLRRESGGYRMVKGLDQASVPDTIQGIIMARLDRLGEDGKRTVQLASVIGRQFLHRLLERIAGLTGRLGGLLQELKALEIIYEQGLLPEPAYIFKHAVIQDVAYQSLLVQRRKELHRAVGHAIEELYPDRLPEHHEELAHHFSQGEEWNKAFEYLVLSGDRAKYAYANQAALDYYARALEAAARVAPPVPPARIMDLHQRRSEVLLALPRYLEAVAESQKMLELARAGGDRPREGRALTDLAFAYFYSFQSENLPLARRAAEEGLLLAREIGDEGGRARSLYSVGCVEQADGNLAEATRLFQESLRICEASGFRETAARCRMHLGAGANWQGEFREAIPLLREAQEASAEIHDGVTELIAVAFRCLSEICLGDYARGLATITEGLAKARERDNAFIQGRLTNTLGWFHQELGDFRRAQGYNLESVDLGRRIKNHNVEISALINVAWDRLNMGEVRPGLELLEELQVRVEKFAFGAHRWRWSMHVSAYLAEALLALGQPERAEGEIDRSLAQALATGSGKYVARAHLLRGRAALAARDWGRGDAETALALETAHRITYPGLVWQAAHCRALVLAAWAEADRAARGKTEEAYRMARLAVETIEALATGAADPALRSSFLGWAPVVAAREDLQRLGRA